MKIKIPIPSFLIALILPLAYSVTNAQAVSPPPDGGYPGGNTAEGQAALLSRTTGGYNTAVGFLSLRSDTTNSFNTAVGAGALLANTADQNTATGVGALLSNTTGSQNTANGAFALFSSTTGGNNTANGVKALFANTVGLENTATGVNALLSNTTGYQNTADGFQALVSNTDGVYNTADGVDALLSNTTGNFNTAEGDSSLFNNTTGSSNIALGVSAGFDLTTGSNNIDCGNSGVADESNTIRIGGTQTATYIAGIAGQIVGAGGSTCYVDNAGKLGVFLSARRYKENIQPMDDVSAALFSLKPVTFRYKPEFDKSGTPQFGLVAEEVADVSPDLVTHNAKGELSTVRYEAVNAMLLNEFLKEHKTVQEQEATITELKANAATQGATIAGLQNQIEALTAGLQKVSAQLELSKPAPQTVLNCQ